MVEPWKRSSNFIASSSWNCEIININELVVCPCNFLPSLSTNRLISCETLLQDLKTHQTPQSIR